MVKGPSKNSSLPPKEGRAVKIGEASKILEVHTDTLRRWEKSGKITPVRTPGGTRIYSLDELSSLIPKVLDIPSKPPPSTKPLPAKNLQEKDEAGIYAHIYNKGIENKVIFCDGDDYKVFLGFLKDYLTAPKDSDSIKKVFTVHGRVFRGTPHQPKNYFNKVELIAYNLMPDHFHLLLHQKIRGSLENFIRSLCTRYSMYFNKKYTRTGALFEGPYKSIPTEESRLLDLTRDLHHTGSYSSYPEYLGARETSWVKPDAVLSSFGKGSGAYKDFVEKYEFDQKGKGFISGLTFESEVQHLERIDLARDVEDYPPKPAQSSEKIYLRQNLKPIQRIPELLATVVVFLLLFTVGVRNITVSSTNNSIPSIVPSVLSIMNYSAGELRSILNKSSYVNHSSLSAIDLSPTPAVLAETEEATSEATLEAKPELEDEATSAATPETEPGAILTVKLSEGTISVNIRQKPTTDSEKIGKAENGDTFEFVSFNSGWYEVKLADGSTGFISEEFIETGGTNN